MVKEVSMPTKEKRQTSLHHKKRHGRHHRRTKEYHKTYLPYLPLIVAILISIVISGWRPAGNTLAYATNTSISGLLAATNTHRTANGQASLALNTKLSSAAQAKANDMVTRNYWSHNTPDGQEPWIFVDATGYSYLKAGENLAYGFSDSDSTVVGWMNSASHKANMLDSAFTEVGFGFANSPDFNSSGPETVVVAMYGKPQALGASSQPTTPPSPVAAPAAQPAPVVQASEPTQEQQQPADQQPITVGFTTATPGLEPIAVPITRVTAMTGTQMPWAALAVGIILGIAVIAFLMKHAIGLRKLLQKSERFVLHHPLFDSIVLGIILIGVTLLQTAGVIL